MTIAKPKLFPTGNIVLWILALASGLLFQACWPFGEDSGDSHAGDANALAELLEANNLDYLDPEEITEGYGGGYSDLRMPGLGLEVVEPYIGRLTGLQNIDLSRNRLRVLSTGFWNLGGLLRINLSGNLIDSIAPGMSALRNLTDIYLDNNDLRSLPAEITSMTRLHTLGLSGNRITELPADFNRIKALSALDLSDNELTALPDSLVLGRSFSSLGVRGNRLCNVSEQVDERLSLYDPDWRATQRCP